MDELHVITGSSDSCNEICDNSNNKVNIINNGCDFNGNASNNVVPCRISVGECRTTDEMSTTTSVVDNGMNPNTSISSDHKYVSIVDIGGSPSNVYDDDSVDFAPGNGDSKRYSDISESFGYPSSGYETDPNISIIDVKAAPPLDFSNGYSKYSQNRTGYGDVDDNDDEDEDDEIYHETVEGSEETIGYPNHSSNGNGDLNNDSYENGTYVTPDGSSCNEQQSIDGDENNRQLREKLKRTRSGSSDYWNNEEMDDTCLIVEFLDKSTDGAEARLAAKRQARAEAREIRMRELERQQREAEETADKVYDIYTTPDALNRSSRVAGSVASPRSSSVLSGGNNSYHSSRRSSEDSLEEGTSIRDMRHELKEVEDKFRKAMIANAQLDNEKAAAAYQVELFKDRLEELDEQHSQLQREHREKCRQFEALKRATVKLQEDLECTRAELEERDRLIKEQGLVIVGGEYSSSEEDNSDTDQKREKKPPKRALVSTQVAEVLQKVGEGSLDVRLKKFLEHRNELLDELNRVKLELEEERSRGRGHHSTTLNGPSDDLEDIQREANKLLGDYKFKLQKAEQDVSTLQANVARLESQVVRYKTAAETAEKVEDDLKVEKRKLQRELRESQARVEELETAHSHLQKRLDKLKNAKSALLKDL